MTFFKILSCFFTAVYANLIVDPLEATPPLFDMATQDITINGTLTPKGVGFVFQNAHPRLLGAVFIPLPMEDFAPHHAETYPSLDPQHHPLLITRMIKILRTDMLREQLDILGSSYRSFILEYLNTILPVSAT